MLSGPCPSLLQKLSQLVQPSRVTHSTSFPHYITHAAWMSILGSGMFCATSLSPPPSPTGFVIKCCITRPQHSSSSHDSDKTQIWEAQIWE